MPPPIVKDTTLWVKSKVSDGLFAANVNEKQRKWVEETFVSLPRMTQQALIDAVGGFGLFASDKDKERRDLCRAMNVALAFHDLLQGKKYVYDRAWREKILTRLDLASARQVVQAQVNAAYEAGQPISAVQPVVLPDPEPVIYTAASRPTLPHAFPVIASIDKFGANGEKLLSTVGVNAQVNRAAAAFKRGGAARPQRLDDFVAQKSGEFGMVWLRATMTIQEAIKKAEAENLRNLVIFGTVLDSAYRKFEHNVKDNQQLLKDNVEIAKKLFGALKHAPPPLSFIGAMGEAASGALKVHDGLDPRSRFATLRAGNSSSFFNKLTAAFDKLRDETLRIGPDLTGFGSQQSLHDTLHKVSKERMTQMSEALAATCNEHFGDTGDVLQRFKAELDDIVTKNRGAIVGRIGTVGETYHAGGADDKKSAQPAGQANATAMICQKIVAYQNELLEEMKPAIRFPTLTEPPEFSYALEILLYSNYIVALYANQVFKGKPVTSGIIDCLSRLAPWGVLMPEADQLTATEKERLSWKDDDHHKRMLLMFCDWYLKNINPFMLLTGAYRNGIPYQDKLIMGLCRVQINRINAAVNSGLSKTMGVTRWDWDQIRAEYKRQCA